MATKVFMEALSPTMEEGRLVKWLKNEGDAVKNGDVLAEVETDKAVMELVARGDGVLRKRLASEGDSSAVGTLLGVIARAALGDHRADHELQLVEEHQRQHRQRGVRAEQDARHGQPGGEGLLGAGE